MQDKLRNIMMYTAGIYGKRYSQHQKRIFAKRVKSVADMAGLTCRIPSAQDSSDTQHIIVGNLEKASVIIACPYDTPGKTLLPGTAFYPFNAEKNLKVAKKEFVCRLALSLIIMAVYVSILVCFNLDPAAFGMIPFHIVSAFISIRIILGISNRYNFRHNSVSLAVSLDILGEKCNKPIAFIFLDKAVNSYEWISALREEDKKLIDKKITLFIGSMGKGSHLCLASEEVIRAGRGKKLFWPESGISGIELDRVTITEKEKESCPLFCLNKCLYMFQVDQVVDGEPVIFGIGKKSDCETDFAQLKKIDEIIKKNIDLLIE